MPREHEPAQPRREFALGLLDINAAVTSIEPMVNQLIGENIRLLLRLDGAAGHVRADAGQIDQIVVNLVVNARDAMPNGRTVTIETSNVVFERPYVVEHFDVKPGPYVLLAVSDTGIGMTRDIRDHVFEPFFTTMEPGKGTGLGLATTYSIVRQSGGHIWVYSEPGHGSTFKLYFPRVDAAVELAPVATVVPMVGTGRVLGVVLVSGYTAETLDLDRVTARGAQFVAKPMTSNQLLQAVLRAGALRRAVPVPS